MPSVVVLENKPCFRYFTYQVFLIPDSLNLTGVDDCYDLRYPTFQILNGLNQLSVKTKLVKEEMHRLLEGDFGQHKKKYNITNK